MSKKIVIKQEKDKYVVGVKNALGFSKSKEFNTFHEAKKVAYDSLQKLNLTPDDLIIDVNFSKASNFSMDVFGEGEPEDVTELLAKYEEVKETFIKIAEPLKKNFQGANNMIHQKKKELDQQIKEMMDKSATLTARELMAETRGEDTKELSDQIKEVDAELEYLRRKKEVLMQTLGENIRNEFKALAVEISESPEFHEFEKISKQLTEILGKNHKRMQRQRIEELKRLQRKEIEVFQQGFGIGSEYRKWQELLDSLSSEREKQYMTNMEEV